MPDGTDKQADTLPAGGQPSPETQNPSQPPTFTQDQVDKLLNDRHRKLDKQIAALTKERDGFKTGHESLSAQFTDLQRRLEDAEEAKYSEDPDGLSKHRREKRNSETIAQLTRERDSLKSSHDSLSQQLANLQKAHEEEELTLEVFNIAGAVGADPARLLEKVTKFGISDTDKIRELALEFWPKKAEPLVSSRPDSGTTKGGTNLTINQVRSNYVAGKLTAEQYKAECKRLGVEP